MAAASSSKSSSSPNASTLARHRSELTRNMLAGSCAISIAVGTFNPLDTLRVRWQVTPEGSGLVSYARQIVAREGLVKGLWTPGLGANMMSFFVCGGFRQGLYPYFRDTLVVATGAEEKSAATMMLGGFGAGASEPRQPATTFDSTCWLSLPPASLAQAARRDSHQTGY
jgi:hypothetical protein